MASTTKAPDYDRARRFAEARGLRLLKHPSNRKVGAWKVKDSDGNVVCWPSPPDVVEDWLAGHLSDVTEDGLTMEEYVEQLERDLAMAESRIEQLERQLVAAGGDPELV